MRAVVLTHYLNAVPDPQRRTRLPADAGPLKVLRDSVAAHDRHLVVLHDCLDERDSGNTTFVRVPPGGNPYWYRWHLSRDWLDAHDVDRVWCVDGTDVEMLHDPFRHMHPGTLYVGSEPCNIGGRAGPWLAQHGRSVRGWLADHGNLPVLNLGLVGGDRDIVRAVCAALADREADGDDYEMPAFQRLVHEDWPDHVTGPQVHTVFRAMDRDSPAWWRHK